MQPDLCLIYTASNVVKSRTLLSGVLTRNSTPIPSSTWKRNTSWVRASASKEKKKKEHSRNNLNSGRGRIGGHNFSKKSTGRFRFVILPLEILDLPKIETNRAGFLYRVLLGVASYTMDSSYMK